MEELDRMMSLEDTGITATDHTAAPAEVVTPVAEVAQEAVATTPVEQTAVATETTPTAPVVNGNTITYNKDNIIPVSEVILNNADKYVNTNVINALVAQNTQNVDLANYIVYINTQKNIPCVYDCTNLCFAKSDVLDANGNSIVTSVEGRRSGFIVKCVGHELVMTKNFIYKCELDANNNITAVYEYSRMRKNSITAEKLYTDVTPTDDYESAILFTQEFLKKVPKKLEDKTIGGLRTEVKKQYTEVNDINAMINIIKLRVEIGC